MAPSTTVLLLGAALFAFGSCKTSSGLTGRATYTSAYYHKPWKAYSTFYINPASETGPSLTALNQKRIVESVRAGMVSRGLTRGDATADLIVNIVSVDTAKTGQLAGRPDNDLFRLYHGGGINQAVPSLDAIQGSLLPDSGGVATKAGAPASARADSAKTAAVRADSAKAVAARNDAAKAAAAVKDSLQPRKASSYVYGALIIEVIDVKQRILLWEGEADKPVDVPMKDPDKRISASVGRLLQKFSLTN